MMNRINRGDGCAISIEARFSEDEGQIWPERKVRPARVLKRAFPTKAAMAIVEYCGSPERTARNYTSAHSEPPWSILDDLLVGQEGFKVLTALMEDDPPTWWINLQNELALAAKARAFHQQLSEQLRG